MHGSEGTRLRVTLLDTLEVCRGDIVYGSPPLQAPSRTEWPEKMVQ